MKIMFALLLENDLAQQCIALSKKISEAHNSLVTLGEHALPHITLVQTECDESDISALWASACNIAPLPHYVSFAGMNLAPAQNQKCWIEIQVLKSQAILGIHAAILEVC